MTDKRIRQAFQAALDMEPIMAAGFGNKAFYRLDRGLFFPEQPQWHSTAGAELYNQKNTAKAATLLKEAGYAGQPVRWITTKEYEWMYKNALVAKQQLEAAGFKVDLQVVDWATLVQRRNKPELWDVFSTGFTFNPEPALQHRRCSATGRAGGATRRRSSCWRARPRDATRKKRRAMSERVQAIFYEDVGRVKFGDYFTLEVTRKDVQGYQARPTSSTSGTSGCEVSRPREDVYVVRRLLALSFRWRWWWRRWRSS